MKVILSLLCFVLCSMSMTTKAQSEVQSLVGTAGGTIIIDDLIIDWSMGESSVSYVETESVVLTEGFQQPNIEVLESSEESNIASLTRYDVNFYPNPVEQDLMVEFTEKREESAILILSSLDGKTIQEVKIDQLDRVTIPMANLTNGTYLLSIMNSAKELVSTSKILKN